MMNILGLAVLAYLVGSVPVGFILGKTRGVDLRTIGSGNYGATNVYRAFNLRLALFVFVMDAAKGFVGARIVPGLWHADMGMPWLRFICGLSVIAGSVASIFMAFRGGKGVATGVGVFLGLTPAATAMCLGIWGALFARFRYVSLGSIIAAVCLPAFIAVFGRTGFVRDPVFYLAVAVAAIVILRHRSNIRRLIEGTENRIGRPRGENAG
jgi:glycerol-3-phosphate acyltransferase PlsY